MIKHNFDLPRRKDASKRIQKENNGGLVVQDVGDEGRQSTAVLISSFKFELLFFILIWLLQFCVVKNLFMTTLVHLAMTDQFF